MTACLLKLNELKEEYTKQYQFYLDKIAHYANIGDRHAETGLRISLKEAREARAMLKVIEEAEAAEMKRSNYGTGR